MARAGGESIERPGEQLAGILLELGFDDRAEDRPVIGEQRDDIGVILDRHELRQRGLVEPCLGEGRHLDPEQIVQERGNELWLVPDELQQTLVEQRRHRGTVPVRSDVPGGVPSAS
ncbi:MAG TPA: hypothetical protein VK932_17760 [Kofleriaceae bacterium]|nr:hypothetical protein [Kofleriaceae bacterium]